MAPGHIPDFSNTEKVKIPDLNRHWVRKTRNDHEASTSSAPSKTNKATKPAVNNEGRKFRGRSPHPETYHKAPEINQRRSHPDQTNQRQNFNGQHPSARRTGGRQEAYKVPNHFRNFQQQQVPNHFRNFQQRQAPNLVRSNHRQQQSAPNHNRRPFHQPRPLKNHWSGRRPIPQQQANHPIQKNRPLKSKQKIQTDVEKRIYIKAQGRRVRVPDDVKIIRMIWIPKGSTNLSGPSYQMGT